MRRQIARRQAAGAISASSRSSASRLEACSSRRRWVHARRCDGATLPTWLAISFSRRLWNAPPSGTGTVAAAVPTQLEDGRLVAGEPPARSQVPRRCALAWTTSAQSAGAAIRRREPQAERRGDPCPRRVDVDERHVGASGIRAQSHPDQRADHARADHGDAAGGTGRGIPDGVECGFHVGGQTRRAAAGTSAGTRHAAARPARRTAV